MVNLWPPRPEICLKTLHSFSTDLLSAWYVLGTGEGSNGRSYLTSWSLLSIQSQTLITLIHKWKLWYKGKVQGPVKGPDIDWRLMKGLLKKQYLSWEGWVEIAQNEVCKEWDSRYTGFCQGPEAVESLVLRGPGTRGGEWSWGGGQGLVDQMEEFVFYSECNGTLWKGVTGKWHPHCDLKDHSGCCPAGARHSMGHGRGQDDRGWERDSPRFQSLYLHLYMTLSPSGSAAANSLWSWEPDAFSFLNSLADKGSLWPYLHSANFLCIHGN